MALRDYRDAGAAGDERHLAEFVYPGEEVGDENATAIVWHYIRVLRRQAWKIVGFVFAVVAGTLLYSFQITPEYQATALLELESLNRMTRLGGEMISYNIRSESKVIETQLRLINSPELIEAVVRDLGLGRSPLFGYPGEGPPVEPSSLPGLSAEMVPGTYLVGIEYRSPSPELCRDVANSVAKAFIQQGYRSRHESSQELQSWLDLQLEDLRARSEEAEQKLLAYEVRHGISRSADRGDLVHDELQRLQEELIATSAERMRKEMTYRTIEAGELQDLLISTEGSPIASLIQRREALELDLAQLSMRYGPNHPNYKRLEARIQQSDGLLERARKQVLERAAAEFREVTQREAAIRENYLEKQGQADRMSELAVEYGTLRREADATMALYEQLLTTVNEVGLHNSIDSNTVRIAEAAQLPVVAVYPNVPRYLLTAFLVSTLLGMGAAVSADYMDRTVRDTAQVEQWLHVPVLANLPQLASGRKPQAYLLPSASDSVLPAQRPQEAYGLIEGFSMLRTSLMLSSPGAAWEVLLVTSAVPSEGKSTVSMGLATSIAQQHPGERVLLVDADLRRPTVHTTFSLPNQTGLSCVLEGRAKLGEVAQQIEDVPSLFVIPRGPSTAQPTELLTTRMGRVIDQLREDYDYVIVDSAPLLASSDSMILSTLVDGVVIVARAGDTSREMVSAAFRHVRRARANVMGLVLNHVRSDTQSAHNYYYTHYGYGRDSEDS